ncbi:hypothetical protein KAJ61_04190 [Candidatus Parcubacteria bacterium]|nr:hypothetical protein [Candidatus Parcubacteria bacterium]
MLKYGNVFYIYNHKNPGIEKHWVVLLYANQDNGVVYFQTLNSGIYKVFPNFGTFKNEFCFNCSSNKKLLHRHLKYKKNPNLYLDVDLTTFLNYKKYKFLRKETFLCLKRIEKDNYFDFNYKIKNKAYKHCGKLNDCNRKSSVISIRYSDEVSKFEINNIYNFYRTCQ